MNLKVLMKPPFFNMKVPLFILQEILRSSMNDFHHSVFVSYMQLYITVKYDITFTRKNKKHFKLAIVPKIVHSFIILFVYGEVHICFCWGEGGADGEGLLKNKTQAPVLVIMTRSFLIWQISFSIFLHMTKRCKFSISPKISFAFAKRICKLFVCRSLG